MRAKLNYVISGLLRLRLRVTYAALQPHCVIASRVAAWQSSLPVIANCEAVKQSRKKRNGLPRRYAARNDVF
ncbi:MAG: hypothetical protein LBE71_00630 [Dysgonamonadaceae bacterium]|jgi:hypothetical protein|nr:hypothetical protein [Dysgonamonadaceae bacterium]